jgi:hypothetical protein
MRKVGNLFTLAEKQLRKEKADGEIPCYTLQDIIEYAVKIRIFLDDNPKKSINLMKLTKKDKLRRNREAVKRCRMIRRIK